MSILNFNNRLLVNEIESSSINYDISSFTTVSNDKQLGHIRVWFYLKGPFAANETIKVCITDSLTSPTYTYESNDVTLQDISSLSTSEHWLGWVRFDFNREWLYASTELFLYLRTSNYTLDGSHEIGAVIDWPVPVYGTYAGEEFDEHSIAFQLFTYEENQDDW